MINIIVAPNSYNKQAEKSAKKIVKYLKGEQMEFSVYFSLDFEKLKTNVQELLSFGENTFVVIGDDIVISAVISQIKDLNKVKLGIIPTGKNDDFARYLKISTNPIQAIKDILLNHTENVDLLLVNDMVVLNTVVVGASVEVYHMYSQYKLKNALSEQFATKKYGNNFPGIDLTLNTKNKAKKETVFDMVVANGGFSKGKPVSPLSNLQDGLFNLNYSTISGKPNKKKYIKMFNKGEHIYNEETKQHWLTNLKVTNPDKKIKALVDGKICNFEEMNISIIESGLKIMKRP